MSGFTWNGGSGDYLDPAQWTPGDVPLYGADTVATITAGNVSLSGAEPNGITLVFGGPRTYQVGPILTLSDAAFGPEMTVDVSNFGIFDIEGYDTNFGTIAIGSPGATAGTNLALNSRGGGQFNQDGTLSVGAAASLVTDTRTVLNNDGLIDLAGGIADVAGAITGTGTIELAAATSTLILLAGVGPGQTVRLQQGAVVVGNAATFQATIAEFTDTAASLTLGPLQFDAATYAQDDAGERLVLTNAGAEVGTIPLADTPFTEYVVTRSGTSTTVAPAGPVYTDGSIPGTIAAGVVTIRNAEPDGQTVALGGPGSAGQVGTPNLVLDNAALGPGLTLAVGTPDVAVLAATMTVRGDDTVYGQINVGTLTDPPSRGGDGQLAINLDPGSRLNQEGTISLVQPQSLSGYSLLVVQSPGTFNNDGQIFVRGGLFLDFSSAPLTGSGTVTIDGGSAQLIRDVASTQTVDLLRGGLQLSSGAFLGTIKDWSSTGVVIDSTYITSVQFNQTSAEGGDLQVFSFNGKQIGDLNLLGTFATSEFSIAHTNVSSIISLVPPA